MVSEDFIETNTPVGSNSVKSTLFRIAAIILKIAVYKLFSLIASRLSTFTAHLMFAENHIQRLLFTVAPGRAFTRQSGVVFGFSILIVLGSLYDQVLWAVDKPGYTQSFSTVLASRFRDNLMASLKTTENSVFIYSDYGRGPGTVDWEKELSAGLFKSGFNASLTSKILRLNRKVTPDQISTNPLNVGEPRIFLDDNGLSLHLFPPRLTSFGFPNNNECRKLTAEVPGPIGESCFDQKNDTLWAWNCSIAKDISGEYLDSVSHSRPFINLRRFGEGESELGGGADIQLLTSSLSPWQYLGVGAYSAINKEIITFRQGTTRHVFLVEYEKVVMQSGSAVDGYQNFKEDDVLDLLNRTGVHGSANLEDSVRAILKGQAEGKSFTIGEQTKDNPFQISSRYYDHLFMDYSSNFNLSEWTGPYLRLPGAAGDTVVSSNFTYNILRCVTVKLTLIMQETLQPIEVDEGIPEICTRKGNKYGGKIRYYTKTQPGSHFEEGNNIVCHEMADTHTNILNHELITNLTDLPTYLGHIDQPSSMVLFGVLEDSAEKTSYSGRVYSPRFTAWVKKNEDRINNLLLARAMLSAMNRSDLAYITVTNLTPAISYLQILLMCIPIVSLIAIYLLFFFFDGGDHYNSSLLMSLLTTTHLTKGLKGKQVDNCNDPPYYLWNMEDVLLRESKDGHVYLGVVQDGKPKRFELVSDVSDDEDEERGEQMEGLMNQNGKEAGVAEKAASDTRVTEVEGKAR